MSIAVPFDTSQDMDLFYFLSSTIFLARFYSEFCIREVGLTTELGHL